MELNAPKRLGQPPGRKRKAEKHPPLTANQMAFLINIDSETSVTNEARVKKWAPFGDYRALMEKKARLVWDRLKTLQGGDLLHVVCQPQMLINETEAAVRQSLGLNFHQVGLKFQRLSPQRSPHQSNPVADSTTPSEVDPQLEVQPLFSRHGHCSLGSDHSQHRRSADVQLALPLHPENLVPSPQWDNANSQLPALDAQLGDVEEHGSILLQLDPCEVFQPKPPYKIAAWSVSCKIPRVSVDRLLQELHTFPPGYDIARNLPKTSKTLLKDAKSDEFEARTFVKVIKGKDCNREDKGPRAVLPGLEEVIGHYVHLGLKNGLLGVSPGCYFYFHNLRALRDAYLLQPSMFTAELEKFIQQRDEFHDNWNQVVAAIRKASARHRNLKRPDHVTLLVDINGDGVQAMAESADNPQLIPIMGRMVGLKTEDRTFVLARTKPFIIGYFSGSRKPMYQRLLTYVAKELEINSPVKVLARIRSNDSNQEEDSGNEMREEPEHEPLLQPESALCRYSDEEETEEVVRRVDVSSDEETVYDTDEEEPLSQSHREDPDWAPTSRVPRSSSLMSQNSQSSICSRTFDGSREIELSTISIQMNRGIGDTPACAEMTGRKGGGFSSLQKCTMEGVSVRSDKGAKGSSVKYPDFSCAWGSHKLRRNMRWKSYSKQRARVLFPRQWKKRYHWSKKSPFRGIPHIGMVSSFVIDVMHTIDGGVLRDLAEKLSNLNKRGVMECSDFEAMNKTIGWYGSFLPSEIQRKVTRLNRWNKWKMRTTRHFFVYIAVPVLAQFHDKIGAGLGEFFFKSVYILVDGLRLVAGFSPSPVDPRNIVKAQECFCKFLIRMKRKFGSGYFTSKIHNLIHFLLDVIRYKCHADANSTYPFEGFNPIWKRLFWPGPDVHTQILNRLVEHYYYQMPTKDSKSFRLASYTPAEVSYLMKNAIHENTNEVPFYAFKGAVKVRKRGGSGSAERLFQWHLEYEGFTLRRNFPQNVCKMDDGTIVVCDQYKTVRSKVYIFGRSFRSLETLVPTGDLDFVVASRLSPAWGRRTWEATEVRAKCAIFPYGIGESDWDRIGENVDPTNWHSWVITSMVP